MLISSETVMDHRSTAKIVIWIVIVKLKIVIEPLNIPLLSIEYVIFSLLLKTESNQVLYI